MLIFTQHFPITQCIEWKEKLPKNNCSLPTDRELWTVHGIWPTKIGAKQGPHFCNKTLKFDKAVLQPILTNLETYWINIEANTDLYSFWKKEWMKHGTCAVTLTQLDTELKYFSQAIEWSKQYNMKNILLNASIVPSQNPYNINDTYNSIHKQIRPVMNCVTEKGTKRSLLSEIQLCFNKSLNLIDCGVLTPNKTGILSDCSLKKPLYYYDKIPVHKTINTLSYYKAYYNKLVNLYEILTMLIKITL